MRQVRRGYKHIDKLGKRLIQYRTGAGGRLCRRCHAGASSISVGAELIVVETDTDEEAIIPAITLYGINPSLRSS